MAIARKVIDDTRQGILEGKVTQVDTAQIIARTQRELEGLLVPSLHRVINASGVILHTNLGRSVLADEAIAAVVDTAKGYSTLEYDPVLRRRGSRSAHYEELLCVLTGAEAALAVNNNAAAVMMVLSVFAFGHQAVVSRGELVEIGGSFRIPDIMAQSGAQMVEVGTTNKTHLTDYRAAIGDDTALLLKVHPSNYSLVGFTEGVDVSELRALADEELARRAEAVAHSAGSDGTEGRHLLVYEDQGSGALVDLGFLDGCSEPNLQASLDAGCDLVSFSGDKLLGGPQAGIIVGRKWCIDRLKASPLARCLRLDKMTLAALEATLRLYLEDEGGAYGNGGGNVSGAGGSMVSGPQARIPTLMMLRAPLEAVSQRAAQLRTLLEDAIGPESARFSLVEVASQAGGGALPLCDIPSCAVQVTFERGSASSCERYLLSSRRIPIICRTQHDALFFDARTLLGDEDLEQICAALRDYFTDLD